MKKIILACALASLSITGLVQGEEYSQNPILRPLTLTDGTAKITGAYTYGEQQNGDSESGIMANFSYGLTDDLQIGLEGLTYSLFDNNTGFELAINAGLRGYHESDDDLVGDSLGYGVNIFGKQVINDNLAITFGTGYTYWNEEHLDNKRENTYSVGVMTNVAKDFTLSAHYTFRDLHDFQQDNANSVTIGLNHALTANLDIGLTLHSSDFEEERNDVAFHETPEKSLGLYAGWRF